jgi:anti-sigma B factor antagonist
VSVRPRTREDEHLGAVHHRISLVREHRATIVEAAGELDAFVADDLSGVLADTSGDERIVLDLTAVSFMDSTVLGLLLRAVREVDGRGGAVRVVLPESTARRIFELTTLDRVLPVSDSRAQALDELSA